MIRDWLQLFRLPNLLTVPGDPIAGALLSGAALDWKPALAALGLYAAGLASNDLFDAAEDARERPDRPIPSGRISRPAAWLATVMLAAGGLLLAHLAGRLLIGAILLGVILLYNAGGKRLALLGPALMGGCRGLSLLLGAVGFPWLAAGTLALYIGAVTGIARHETGDRPVGPVRWLPAAVLLVGFALLLKKPTPLGLAAAAAAILLAWLGGRALTPGAYTPAWLGLGTEGGKRTPAVIGLWIGALLPIQAAFCAQGAEGLEKAAAALVLLACWPLFRVLSGWFYAS